MGEITMPSQKSILIINPNSTESMTDALRPLIDSLGYKQTHFTFYTAPSGPKSINNEDDAAESVPHCMKDLPKLMLDHDGLLVACYSEHPLVTVLKSEAHIIEKRKPVTGIFEASVATSLQLIDRKGKFGIVSTGKVWEEILSDAVTNLLGAGESSRFAGVETTGLNATELHDAPAEEVKSKMKEATKRLLRKGDVGAICLGCAGMSGMNEMVREAAVEELGKDKGESVRIVDGVQAGAAWLDGAVRTDY